MAITQLPQPPEVHRFPQCKFVEAVRWLPPISALHRHAVLACVVLESQEASLEIHSLNPQIQPKELTHVATWDSPARISCLNTTQFGPKPIVIASTEEGSLHFLEPSEDGSIGNIYKATEIHSGQISGVDVVDSGDECVSVGKDGMVNLVNFGVSGIIISRFFNSNGLVSYTAVKWASPSEFATGGHEFGLQWWDKRKPGGPVSRFENNWAQGRASEIHSMDIFPSQKYTCVAGGSSGRIFVWDLRRPQQPVVLSGAEIDDSVSKSDVWEVQFDRYDRTLLGSSSISSSSSHILPVVMGSQDGILAVIEQDKESVELLSHSYVISKFDIDKQNPSEIICGCDWEGVAIVSRL